MLVEALLSSGRIKPDELALARQNAVRDGTPTDAAVESLGLLSYGEMGEVLAGGVSSNGTYGAPQRPASTSPISP